jgi:hypothetical protein
MIHRMKSCRGCSWVGALAWWLAVEGAATAAPLTNAPAADTTLFEYVPDHNLGGDLTTAAGATKAGTRSRTLWRFDLSAIPPGSQIHAVTLTFTVVRAPTQAAPQPSFFALHRMRVPWAEGNKFSALGAPAGPDEPTWNARAHGAAPWSAPGATAPTDFNGAASGVTATAVTGLGDYAFPSSTGLVADVQAWVNDPATNHGWILISQGEGVSATARRLGAREDSLAAPRLVVDFSPAPAASVPELTVDQADGIFRLHFTAQAGRSYSVQARSNLAVGEWTTWTNLPPPPATTNLSIGDPVAPHAGRFYRVRSP